MIKSSKGFTIEHNGKIIKAPAGYLFIKYIISADGRYVYTIRKKIPERNRVRYGPPCLITRYDTRGTELTMHDIKVKAKSQGELFDIRMVSPDNRYLTVLLDVSEFKINDGVGAYPDQNLYPYVLNIDDGSVEKIIP